MRRRANLIEALEHLVNIAYEHPSYTMQECEDPDIDDYMNWELNAIDKVDQFRKEMKAYIEEK